jgi:MATE family multidrug resistance protein
MEASTVVLVLATPINIGLNIAFVHHTSLGLLGSPVALSIVYWLMFLLLTLYICISKTHARNETWGGFKPKVVFQLGGCWTFLKLALPGILMVGTEW